MKVLACGDRLWLDRDLIRKRLLELVKDARDADRLSGEWTLIHGACRGADSLAGDEGARIGFKVVEFPADWEQFGRAAGPIRNVQMLKENPDLVLAFHDNIHGSRGTAHTVREARKLGIRVEVIGHSSLKVYPGQEKLL